MRACCGAAVLLVPLLGSACSSSGGEEPEAGAQDAARTLDGFGADASDAASPTPVTFTAEPDPDEPTGCLPEPPGEGEVRAKHASCAAELPAGSVAMGQVGDLLLENARAKFVVRGLEGSATLIGAYAGAVVDAAPQGAPDLLKEVMFTLDASSVKPDAIVVTDAGGGGTARVRVLFHGAQLGLLAAGLGDLAPDPRFHGAVDYALGADENALRVTVRITPEAGRRSVGGEPGFAVMLGGAAEVLQPGQQVLGRLLPGEPEAVERPVLLGETRGSAFAFGLVPEVGHVTALQSIMLVSTGERRLVRVGEELAVEARLGIGRTAAEAVGALGAPEDAAELVLEGAAGDRVGVRRPGGLPLLRTAFDPDGTARVRLLPGDYEVRSGFGPYFPGPPTGVSLDSSGTRVAVAPPPAATLQVEATAGGAADAPVRVTVEQDGAEVARFVASGTTDERLPPGDYRVTVSRGMEFDVHQQDVTLEGGTVTMVAAILDRVVDTRGWVSGDFHLHSEMSTDSRHAQMDAVRMIAAEGLEVVAATDHDFLNDYSPAIEAAGLSSWLVAVVGNELSHPILAHLGAYPLAREPTRTAGGAPAWFDTTPGQWMDDLRALGDPSLGGAVLQLNHPRRSNSGFFEAIELDRATGQPTQEAVDLGLPADTDLGDFDIDVIEVWNRGPGGDDEEALADYLALYGLGQRFTMVGNSDSHGPREPAGSPRNFLRVPDDTLGSFGWQDAASALRAGEVTVAGGIFVTAELAGPVSAGQVPVAVRVLAPPWVEVDRLRVYAGREVALDMPLAATSDVSRFDDAIDVPLSGAGFVVVRVDGPRAPVPMIPFAPFGITNPLPLP